MKKGPHMERIKEKKSHENTHIIYWNGKERHPPLNAFLSSTVAGFIGITQVYVCPACPFVYVCVSQWFVGQL